MSRNSLKHKKNILKRKECRVQWKAKCNHDNDVNAEENRQRRLAQT